MTIATFPITLDFSTKETARNQSNQWKSRSSQKSLQWIFGGKIKQDLNFLDINSSFPAFYISELPSRQIESLLSKNTEYFDDQSVFFDCFTSTPISKKTIVLKVKYQKKTHVNYSFDEES